MSTFFFTRRGWLGSMLLGSGSRGQERQYRIDAAIVLLGVPVFRRKGVGSGWARVDEKVGERRLRFAAGSLPEQAKGLNRLGYVEERASEGGSTYFGFMSASGEESFAEAKRALAASGGPEAQYTAIGGEVRAGRAECRRVRFLFPAHYDWTRWEDLFPMASEAFAKTPGEREVMAEAPQEALHSFLQTLTREMAAGVGERSRAFVYGNRRMLLTSQVQREGALLRMDGKTQLTGKTLSQFRLWYREGSSLPERVEVQVKAFLRLTLV